MKSVSPLLSEALPDLAQELTDRLHALSEDALARQVQTLRIKSRCGCGDDFCATFYTGAQPRGAYGPSHRNVDLEPEDGYLILDVVNGKIMAVEVLYRDAVRKRLFELFPKASSRAV